MIWVTSFSARTSIPELKIPEYATGELCLICKGDVFNYVFMRRVSSCSLLFWSFTILEILALLKI